MVFKLYYQQNKQLLDYNRGSQQALIQMMKNWDFVDPKLARKLKQVTKQIQQFKQKRVEILNNNRISQSGKKKLLEMNQGYISDLMSILQKQQQGMIDYFDKQLTIITKKQVKQISTNQCAKKDILCDQTTGIQLQNDGWNNSYSLNKTKLNINLNSNENEEDKERKYRFDELSTTGRMKSRQPRQKPISSFELNQTIRRQAEQNAYSFRKEEGQKTKRSEKRRKGSVTSVQNRRMKRKLVQKEFELEMQRVLNGEKKEKIRCLEKEREEDKEIIELLYRKIGILETKIKQQASSVRKGRRAESELGVFGSNGNMQQELKGLKRNYEQLENVLKQNKELEMRRKQLIKMHGK